MLDICTRSARKLGSVNFNAATVNGNSLNIWFFPFSACPSPSCNLITTEVTTSYITERSSNFNPKTLAASSLYTPTHVKVVASTADRKSSAFHHTTFYSGSSWSLNVPEKSVTKRYSSLYSQCESVKLSTITVASSFQTSTLRESVSSSVKLSSSSRSLVSSSLLLLLSTPSPSSSCAVFQTTSHGFASFLTPSPARKVQSSSLTPSPSTVRPTDGIEVEIKPHHNVSDTVIIIMVLSLSLYFFVHNFESWFYF